MIFIPLHHTPSEEIRDSWIITEIGDLVGFNLTEAQLVQIVSNYKYIQTKHIPPHLRFLLNKENQFVVGDISWEIINLDTYEKILELTNKVEFTYELLPLALRQKYTWDSILEGVKIIYLEEPTFKHLVKNFAWVPIESIPLNHRHKGETIYNHNLIILEKSLLPTIFRKLSRQG